VLEDPIYLEVKQRLGEKLTPGERARLEAARAASAQPAPVSAQPEGGEP
jgi:ABC-type lipopolysaccharide export system ATPase subunit